VAKLGLLLIFYCPIVCGCVCVCVCIARKKNSHVIGSSKVETIVLEKIQSWEKLWDSKALFHLCNTPRQFVKKPNYVGITMCRQGKKVISCLSFHIVYCFLDVCVMCDGI
jgi:hypothetical protein